MKTIVITGATSMIALGLIEECLAKKIKIFAVVHPDSLNVNRIPRSDLISIIKCDHRNYKDLENLINTKCDDFYHFAWKATGKKRDLDTYLQVENIIATLDCIHVAKQLDCKKFVGAGSQAEYGKVKELPISPDTVINPNTPYGISKYAAGQLALFEAQKLGVDCIWVRIFSVYGKFDKPTSMIMSTIDKLIRGENHEFTKAEQLWDYIHYLDAGKAFYLIGKSGKPGVYCLGSGEAKQLKEFIYAIRDNIDPNIGIRLGGIPYSQEGPRNLCADISKLTADTGFHPNISFESGIKLTIKWFKIKSNYETS